MRIAAAAATRAKCLVLTPGRCLPQRSAWPMIGIFNSYVEIEKWVSELHEDYAESTVSSVFATFSTFLNAAVRARIIPASPCSGIRARPATMRRSASWPHRCKRYARRCGCTSPGLGLGGFTLCLTDFYTGGRWGELAGQQRHEYGRRCSRTIVAASAGFGGT